jgi:hypothetical protein
MNQDPAHPEVSRDDLKWKKVFVAVAAILFFATMVSIGFIEMWRIKPREKSALAYTPADSASCVECHQKLSPGIVSDWMLSRHSEKGVGCLACHQAESQEPDAFEHYGSLVATVVSPNDCNKCHAQIGHEFQISHHSKAAQFIGSLDNFLGEFIEGRQAAVSGCMQCHGSSVSVTKVFADNTEFTQDTALLLERTKTALAQEGAQGLEAKVRELTSGAPGLAARLLQAKSLPHEKAVLNVMNSQDYHSVVEREENAKRIYYGLLLSKGRDLAQADLKKAGAAGKLAQRIKFDSDGWPNTGIGRINPDLSNGSCTACHSRHKFQVRMAREPESCGKCHLGPDHPQYEVYNESKHGIAFRANRERMNLDAHPWVVGQDYDVAPTCATCHMGATRGQRSTHDVGKRISWTLRPAISEKVEHWEERRSAMQEVCSTCHAKQQVENFYRQFDGVVNLYNEKFAKPGRDLINVLAQTGAITPSPAQMNVPGVADTVKVLGEKGLSPNPFDDEVEWTWYLLWHHEGRRARHGASMMAPDYTQWHGMFEVAHRFYFEMVPQAKAVLEERLKEGRITPAQRDEVLKVIDGILARTDHAWLKGLSAEQKQEQMKFYKERYNQ